MRCPVHPDVDLLMSERSGVEIDYCPTCRGVWLDRGELDKILERSRTEVERLVSEASAPPPAPSPAAPPEWSSEYDERGRDRWTGTSPGPEASREEARPRKGKKRPKTKTQKAFDLLDDLFDL